MELRPGTLLQDGKYRIVRTLGHGGFGITYLAEHITFNSIVCIKEYFPQTLCYREKNGRTIATTNDNSLAGLERFKLKFLEEASKVHSLRHGNIVSVSDRFEENNTAYYVMDFINGETLDSRIKREGGMSEKEAIRYIRQIAQALKYVHARNMLHLDIKPANIMLRKEDDSAVLIDFGLAKHYDPETGSQTTTYLAAHSPGYAPFEQTLHNGVEVFCPATDIYSLGATLYASVVGKCPPEAASIPNEGLPTLPFHLSSSTRLAIQRSMEYSIKRRPQDIVAFLQLLDVCDGDDDSDCDTIVDSDSDIDTEVIKWVGLGKFIQEENLHLLDKHKISRRIIVGILHDAEDVRLVSRNTTQSMLLYGSPKALKNYWISFIPGPNIIYLLILTLGSIPRWIKFNSIKRNVCDVESNSNVYKRFRNIDGKFGVVYWLHCGNCKTILGSEYSSIKFVDECNVVVKKDNLFGLYNLRDEKWVLPCRFNSMYKKLDNTIVAKNSHREVSVHI